MTPSISEPESVHQLHLSEEARLFADLQKARRENLLLRSALRRAVWSGICPLGQCRECARKLTDWVYGLMIEPLPEMCEDCRKIRDENGGPA